MNKFASNEIGKICFVIDHSNEKRPRLLRVFFRENTFLKNNIFVAHFEAEDYFNHTRDEIYFNFKDEETPFSKDGFIKYNNSQSHFLFKEESLALRLYYRIIKEAFLLLEKEFKKIKKLISIDEEKLRTEKKIVEEILHQKFPEAVFI